MKTLAVAVMAAGKSSRFGSNKLLATLGDKGVAELALSAYEQIEAKAIVTQNSKLSTFAVSLGYRLLAPEGEDKADSVKAATLWASEIEADGLMFAQADQALILPATIGKLKAAFDSINSDIWRLSYKGKDIAPVIFASPLFGDLMQIEGDVGGSKVIKDKGEALKNYRVEAAFDFETLDADTPLALEQMQICYQRYTKQVEV